MCGLTGFWQPKSFSIDAAQNIAERMAGRIAYRGPDDAGVWMDEGAGIALAHRRLSILDLSLAGHQPMISWLRLIVRTCSTVLKGGFLFLIIELLIWHGRCLCP